MLIGPVIYIDRRETLKCKDYFALKKVVGGKDLLSVCNFKARTLIVWTGILSVPGIVGYE